jgi:hypothetical protein
MHPPQSHAGRLDVLRAFRGGQLFCARAAGQPLRASEGGQAGSHRRLAIACQLIRLSEDDWNSTPPPNCFLKEFGRRSCLIGEKRPAEPRRCAVPGKMKPPMSPDGRFPAWPCLALSLRFGFSGFRAVGRNSRRAARRRATRYSVLGLNQESAAMIMMVGAQGIEPWTSPV